MNRILVSLSLALLLAAQAGPPARAAEPEKKKNVLDFESDVIEGQKKAPELFLQTEVQKAPLDSILFQRKNFNDLHSTDRRRRPRIFPPTAEPQNTATGAKGAPR